jgi:hypothetical protein
VRQRSARVENLVALLALAVADSRLPVLFPLAVSSGRVPPLMPFPPPLLVNLLNCSSLSCLRFLYHEIVVSSLFAVDASGSWYREDPRCNASWPLPRALGGLWGVGRELAASRREEEVTSEDWVAHCFSNGRVLR